MKKIILLVVFGNLALITYSQDPYSCDCNLPVDTYLSSNDLYDGDVFCVNDDIEIASDVTFSNAEFVIAPGKEIRVDAGASLTIIASHLHSCEQMWQGINVMPGGRVIITGNDESYQSSFIEDAVTAVNLDMENDYPYSSDQDYISVDNTIFNRNRISISFSNYHVYYLSGTYPLHVKNTLFTCRDIPYSMLTWDNLATVRYSSHISAYPATPNVMADPFIEDASYAPYAFLKYPYNTLAVSSGHSYIGIELSNLLDIEAKTTEVLVGTDDGVDNDGNFPTVIFDDLIFGIKCSDTRLTVYDCTFQKYLNDYALGAWNQTAIYAVGYSDHTKLRVINPDPGNIPNNAIFNMYDGIHCIGYKECEIKNSDFRGDMDITNNSGGHVWNAFLRGLRAKDIENLTVENNTLYNISEPIYIEYTSNPVGPTSIQYNTIGLDPGGLNPPNPEVLTGVTILGLTTPPLSNNPNGVVVCSHNTFDQVCTGIIESNFAIEDGTVEDNYIKLSEFRQWDWSSLQWGISWNGYGIKTEAVGTSFLYTNKIKNNTIDGNLSDHLNNPSADTAAISAAQNYNQIIGCNAVSNCINGLDCLGSNTVTNVIKNTIFPSNYWGLRLDQAGLIGPQVSTDITSDNDWLYDNATWAGVGSYKTMCSNSTDPINSILYVQSASNLNPDGSNDFDGTSVPYSTSTGSLVVTTPEDETTCDWEGVQKGSASHHRGSDTSAAEKIALARLNIPSPDSALRLYVMQQQLCANLYGDTAFLNSSTILQSFMQANATTNFAAINRIGSAISQGDTATASFLLSGMAGTNQVDHNYMLFFNWVLANYNQLQSGNTSQLNTAAIYHLALGCPFIDGIVVYAARNLYNSIAKETVRFKNACGGGEQQGRPGLANRKFNGNLNGEVSIYPNPSSDGNFTIRFTDKSRASKKIVVTDVYGKIILQKIENSSQTSLKVNGAKGVYFVTTIVTATGKREVKKVLIQ